MSTHFLFVTAKLPIDRVNEFLTIQKKAQDEDAGLKDSIFLIIRDPEEVPYEDIGKETSEPPVKDFKSGFIDASDEELWNTLAKCREWEDKQDRGSYLHEITLTVLDEQSKKDDTVLLLYNSEAGDKSRFRVPFKFVWHVVAQMPFQERESAYLESVDNNGVIKMTEVHKKLGVTWEHGDR